MFTTGSKSISLSLSLCVNFFLHSFTEGKSGFFCDTEGGKGMGHHTLLLLLSRMYIHSCMYIAR